MVEFRSQKESVSESGPATQTIIIQQPKSSWLKKLFMIGLVVCLFISILLNFMFMTTTKSYLSGPDGPQETFRSGNASSLEKIAVIPVKGTIMGSTTTRILKSLKQAREDKAVKAILLEVDSPGGLVADSHQIYHELKQIEKPMAVYMKRLAASGGYYISMGIGEEGKIFAEPTAWTGSIGVIIPRYNAADLADKIGVESEPLKTGPFKDALSPFRDLSDEERTIWEEIMEESFGRFKTIIAENRKTLDDDQVRALATGQIYTADQAKQNGMIDEIGFEKDVIEHLSNEANLSNARVVTYTYPATIVDMLVGSVKANSAEETIRMMAETTVPQQMYFFSWGLGLPPLK